MDNKEVYVIEKRTDKGFEFIGRLTVEDEDGRNTAQFILDLDKLGYVVLLDTTR